MILSVSGLVSATLRLLGSACPAGLILVLSITGAEPTPPTAPTPAAGFHTVRLNGHTFTLPVGFTIELAAGPKLAERPVSGSFDDKGRLYVTDSSGDNSRAPEQAKTKTHRIRRLTDTNGDGVFDQSTLFVKSVAMPQGALFYKGSLYVAAPPSIMKYTDTDDDGVADREEVWFDGKTVGGCGNDLHGPWIGPDGWFYWTKGGFEKQEYTLANGKRWSTRAAHVFRAKPDGTAIEPVMTGGMDNPVGLTFTPTGEVLVCGTFFQHPADGKRDGIIHAVYGGVFGKDHNPIHEHPWTGPDLLPIMTHLGPAAPCALTRYQSDQFGTEYVDNVFCAQFNLRRVSRHVLVPEGSTYRTVDSDFVVSDQIDFHPTDVIEDTDGSLLIVDTGGWYKLCCPTSQLAKEDVFGAIYRVRKTGDHGTRSRPETKPLPRLKAIALNRDHAGLTTAIESLKSADPHERRQAVEALDRLGDFDGELVTNLIGQGKNDRFLDHACIHALIERNDPTGLNRCRVHPSPAVGRAFMIAEEFIPNGASREVVLGALDTPDAATKAAAWWIAGRHPEWGESLARRFAEQVQKADTLTPAEREELVARLTKFIGQEAVQKALGQTPKGSIAAQRLVLNVMARSGLKSLPAAWKPKLVEALSDVNGPYEDAFAVLRAVPTSRADYSDIMSQALKGGPLPLAFEMGIYSSSPQGTTALKPGLDFLLDKLGRQQPAAIRALAVEGLLRLTLAPEQLVEVAGALKAVTPVEFAKLLPAFGSSKNETVGLAFVAALTDPAVRRIVRTEQVKPILDKYPAAVKTEAEKLYALLAEDRKEERAKLDALIANAPPGDVRRGQAVFNSAKAACMACHKIGYVGGTVGPDLRRIGAVRTPRDLYEAIVFPSASFVRSYEPFRIVTVDGKSYNGVLRKDAPDEIVLALSADQEVRIPRADIEEMTPSTVSVMPAGLDQQLSPQELADLVAFLRANVR